MRQYMRHYMRAAVTAATLAGVSLALHAQDKPGAQDKPIGEVVTQNGKVRVEVLSLKRIEGNLVTLRWRIVNDGSSNFTMTPGNARLIDLTGRRQYEPGLTGSQCNAKPDERTVCWATYAAPPASTRTLAVKFYEQFDLLTGVPISD
jgi:hypothetical protein